MAKVALGFRVHLGWAAAVAVAGPRAAPEIRDRRELRLSTKDVPESHEPYHKAALVREDEKAAREIVRRGTQAIDAVARKQVRAWLEDLERGGDGVIGAGILMASGRETTFASTLASHALVHTAEGQLMRDTLIRACEGRDLRVVRVREKELYDRASAKLEIGEPEIKARLAQLGRDLGPPWKQDQKSAALVAWLCLAGLRS